MRLESFVRGSWMSPGQDLAEIHSAVEIAKAGGPFSSAIRIVSVGTAEPSKAQLLRDLAAVPRLATVVLYDRADGKLYEVRVDLGAHARRSITAVPGAQPSIMLDEFGRLSEIVKAVNGAGRGSA